MQVYLECFQQLAYWSRQEPRISRISKERLIKQTAGDPFFGFHEGRIQRGGQLLLKIYKPTIVVGTFAMLVYATLFIRIGRPKFLFIDEVRIFDDKCYV